MVRVVDIVRACEALDMCRVEAKEGRLGRSFTEEQARVRGLCAGGVGRKSLDDRTDEFLAERLGLDAVDGVRNPLDSSESLLTSVYIVVAEELRRSRLGRASCSSTDAVLIADILRSPVIGLTSITSCAVSCRMLLPKLTRAEDGLWIPLSKLMGSGLAPLSLRVLEP